jgi:carbonic anhydrase
MARNRAYAAGLGRHGQVAAAPTMRVAIVTCMDARIETGRMLGLREGEVHVIRNAGGTVTEDVLRSLAISQVVHGTREIVVMKHTDCGLGRFGEHELRGIIAAVTGAYVEFSMGTFRDVDAALRDACQEIRESELIPYKASIRGLIYDVRDGTVRELSP